ncbi:MAG: ParB/RepB/Spo0J family partition protein [Deltaproteobacteria bacterium]|nr:ParB/RepB/Spo0J family partition protein [Deltaproteobacteria bacterium]
MSKRKLVLANNPLLSGPALGERERIGIPYRQLALNAIERDPNQPRVHFDEDRLQELASSIRTYGILSPLLVRPSKVAGKYILISGERRMRAAQLVGLATVPALIDQTEVESGERTLAMQLVENLQRADLSPLERAHAIGALKESYSLSIREVADRLGVSKGMVQRSLDILELPDDLLNALREGASESKILLLSKIENEEIRASYLKDLDVLTRNQLKKDIEKSSTESEESTNALSPEDHRIADEIRRALGTKVRMFRPKPDSEGGRITIDFYTNEDLQVIFRRLVAEG